MNKMQYTISHIITVSTMILRNLWSKTHMPKIQKQHIYIEKSTNHFYKRK